MKNYLIYILACIIQANKWEKFKKVFYPKTAHFQRYINYKTPAARNVRLRNKDKKTCAPSV